MFGGGTVPDTEFFRDYNPDTADVRFWGDTFNLREIVSEAKRILGMLGNDPGHMHEPPAQPKDERLRHANRRMKQERRWAWLRGGWRDTLAAIFSRAAREEQRQWKKERDEEMAKWRTEQDALWAEAQRKAKAGGGQSTDD